MAAAEMSAGAMNRADFDPGGKNLGDCLESFLSGLAGEAVYFDAMSGNHGDRLLVLAARDLLASVGVTYVDRPRKAAFIIMNGGGAMAEGWFGLERLRTYCRRYPRVPLIILPSSFYLPKTRLADWCAARKSPLYLWARERPSLEVLRGANLKGNVALGLDHDLALRLAGHPLVKDLETRMTPEQVLVVERDDWEGVTGRQRPLVVPGLGFISSQIRGRVRRKLVGAWRRRQDRESAFAAAARRFVAGHHPDMVGVPFRVADVSLAETCDFDAFLHEVARAAVIVSTRLHVAILGYLLGIPTYLVDGSYHKYRGVFDYSLQQGCVTLLTWDGTRLDNADHYRHAR